MTQPSFSFEESLDACLLLSGRCQLSWPRLDGKPWRADCSAFARALRDKYGALTQRSEVRGDSTAPWESPTVGRQAIRETVAERPDAFGEFAVAALGDLNKQCPDVVKEIRAAVPVPDETTLADLARERPDLAFNLVSAVLADGTRT